MQCDKYFKRWNKIFIHDRIMPEWIYILINILMSILDLWYLILLFIARVRSKKNICRYYFSICAIFKDEALSMKEWIEYHRLVGVSHIYLYNNNTTDDSIEILQYYINIGYVTLIEWKFKPPCQAEAYNHFKDNFWDETQWVAFIDLDEYICPKRAMQVQDWFMRYESYPSLVIYWKMFGSSGLIEHDKHKLITEQYFLSWDKFTDIGKPVFNTRFQPVATSLKYIHLLPAEIKVLGCKFTIPPINEFKKFIKYRSNRVGLFSNVDDFSMQINHYATKAYNEYYIRRRLRGDVNAFSNNTSNRAYQYVQEFAIMPDYTIYRFLPFLKVRMNKGSIENYFDAES